MTARSADAEADRLQRSNRWTVALFALVGIGLGLTVYAFSAPVYEAEATVQVNNPVGTIADEVDIAAGDSVLSAAAAVLGFDPDVEVSPAQSASSLIITARGTNAEEVAASANTVASSYIAAQTSAAASLAQRAEVPTSRSGLGPLVYAVLGTLVGALVGSVVSAAQMRRQRRAFLSAGTARPAVPESWPARPVPTSSLSRDAESSVAGGSFSSAALASSAEPPAPVEVASLPDVDADAPPVVDAAVDAETSPPVEPDPIDREPRFANAGDGRIEAGAASAHVAPDAAPVAAASVPLTEVDDAEPLGPMDRRALERRFDAARYELVLLHDEEVARLKADHEREITDLRAEAAGLAEQVRVQRVRLNNQSGDEGGRVADLELQVDALETELSEVRDRMEAQRIAHATRVTEEREIADRTLDDARRQYRDELGKQLHRHRSMVAELRAELDRQLATERGKQRAELDALHAANETKLNAERARAESRLSAAQARHERELSGAQEIHRQELNRQANQHQKTIEALRATNDESLVRIRKLEHVNRKLQRDGSASEEHARQELAKAAAAQHELRDEIAVLQNEIQAEQERNAALRADVLRRSVDAHHTIDRAAEERTSQLAELEASVARQRSYAEERVREISAVAEQEARAAAAREAALSATVARLTRELDDVKRSRFAEGAKPEGGAPTES